MAFRLLMCTLAISLARIASGGTIIAIDGNNAVAGLPGNEVGWGFSVTSDVYPLFTGSQFSPDPNTVGTYVDYLASSFFFGLPNVTVTDSFIFGLTGAGEFDVSNSAALGGILFGNLQLFWDEYSVAPDDPNFDPEEDLLSSGNSALLGVSVTVGDQATPVPTPEPRSLWFAAAGLAFLAWRKFPKASVRILLPLLLLTAVVAPSARAFQGPPVTDRSSAEIQALNILRNQELFSSSSTTCHTDDDPTKLTNCCGSPGVAGCVTGLSDSSVRNSTTDGRCTVPSANTPRTDVSGRILCNPPKAGCDGRIGTSLQSYSKAGPQNVTFYFTSDIHWFRSKDWRPENQIRHVRILNDFPNTFPWMSTPQLVGDVVGSPAGIVLGGDFATFGSAEELGAQRLLFEPQIDASLTAPLFLGLGNHDLTGSSNFFNDDLWGPQRMFNYLQDKMNCGGIHFDPLSGNYSWDWGRLHLVMLNTWAGDKKTNLPIPTNAGLDWLAKDLATNVGATGRPVILFQHYAFDCFAYTNQSGCQYPYPPSPDKGYWLISDTTTFQQVIQEYNVVALFAGHTHTPSVDRVDNTYYAMTANIVSFNDTHGNPRLFDVFTNGDGGEDGHGDFLAVRYTDGATPDSAPYLDVQSMRWTNGQPTVAIQPSPFADNTGAYFGGLLGCRKRINNRFNDVTGQVNLQVSPQAESLFSRVVSLTNPSHSKFSGQLAIQVQSLGDDNVGYLTRPDFVDSCGLAPATTTAPNGSYALLTDAQVAALNGTTPVSIPLAFANDTRGLKLHYALVSITPLVGASPSSFDVNLAPAEVQTQSFTVYGAPNTGFFLALSYTVANDIGGNPITQSWIQNVLANGATCSLLPGCSGQFDGSGRLVVSFQVNANALAGTIIALPNAIFTVDASSGASGRAATVPVTVHFETGVTIKVTSFTASPYDTTKGPAVFMAQLFATDGQSVPTAVDPSTGVVHPTGRVFLSEATLDTGGNVVSTTPLSYVTYLNKSGSCDDLFGSTPHRVGQLPHDEQVVFGDIGFPIIGDPPSVGGQGYCPSFAYPGQNPFASNLLTFRLHHFVVQYEGDHNFLPASSAPFDYLVEIPLLTLSTFDGSMQSTLIGTPFALPITAKVLQVGNATQSGIPVTFTVPSPGPSGVFAGNVPSVTVLTNTSGLAVSPVFNANLTAGHYTITATTQGLTTFFGMTNLPPGVPLLTATIAPKSGPMNARIWPVKVTNTQVDAFGAAISTLTLAQVAGTACTPVVQTPLPIALGDIASTMSATAQITIDASSCATSARFTVQVGVTASGNYQKTSTIGNQFP